MRSILHNMLATRAIALLGEPLWQQLATAYAAPIRAYHNLQHLTEMLARYDEVLERWRRPRATLLALLFHDAIYDALAHDNEEKSAAWMNASATMLDADDRARATELILLTARHSSLRVGDVDDEAALFLDCDMAIVAAPSARYAEYERAIAVEYAAVPAEMFAMGRQRFLRKVLASERIFLSDYFHARLDAAARENLQLALG